MRLRSRKGVGGVVEVCEAMVEGEVGGCGDG